MYLVVLTELESGMPDPAWNRLDENQDAGRLGGLDLGDLSLTRAIVRSWANEHTIVDARKSLGICSRRTPNRAAMRILS